MATSLQSPTFCAMLFGLQCSSKSKRSKKQKQLQRRLIRHNKSTTPSFPKSYPTPLLVNHKPYTQTKSQALDEVINDLEASVEKGISIGAEIFSSLLETCYQLQEFDQGIRVRRLIPQNLLRRNIGLSSKLLRLYASFGYIEDAHDIFDQMPKRDASAFPWNSLISGYAELGECEDAIALYFQMEEEGVEPDRFTFPRVLKACGGIGSIQIGEAVHRHIVRSGFANDRFVLNALVDMYAKCGDIVKARKIFDKIADKDLISWNSMLSSYIHHGLFVEALKTFCHIIQEGYEPDAVAISSILAGVSSLKLVLQIHGWVIRHGFEWNLSVANSLLVVYSNQGKLERARSLFNQMPERDVVSWNSIISAHRKDPKALIFFEQMEASAVIPDAVTFVSLLSACAKLGLLDDGKRIFSIMEGKYGITPSVEHYACMVNLYGRVGLTKEAYAIIAEEMEFEAGPTVWGALLYSCSFHGDVEIGEIAAERLFDLEPDNVHNFELLMKIYRNAGRLEDEKTVRTIMVGRGLDHSDV